MRLRRVRVTGLNWVRSIEDHGRKGEEEEERSLLIDLKRHARLAVAWSRHGSLVPRWT